MHKSEADILKHFGEILRSKREAQKISQEELAFQIGSHATHISRLENGRKKPSLIMILNIGAALKVQASELLIELEGRLIRDN